MSDHFLSMFEKIPLRLHLQYQKRAVTMIVMTVMIWINTFKQKEMIFCWAFIFAKPKAVASSYGFIDQ